MRRLLPLAALAGQLALTDGAWAADAAARAVSPLPAARAPDVDVLGIGFVRVPAGVFEMGSEEPADRLAAAYPQLDRSRFEALADEAPVHRVRITRPFEMSRHEVTVGQFRAFLQRSGHVPESIADGSGGYGYNPAHDPATSPRRDAFEGRRPAYSWQNAGFAQADDHPVVNVTWNDAVALARWLSAQEGRRYRLPTEAEWEYACRAGARTRYQHGDDPEGLVRVANIFDADGVANWPAWLAQALSGRDGHAFTAPVGSYAPNAFGLHDLHGNVWEWVSDWYGEDYYRRSPPDDPTGPAHGETRVRRGGSWHSWALYSRCSFRNWNTPQTRYTLVGIRLVRDVVITDSAGAAAVLRRTLQLPSPRPSLPASSASMTSKVTGLTRWPSKPLRSERRRSSSLP